MASNSHISNKEIVKHYAEEQFKKSFQTLSPQENTDFINELLKNSIEFDTFKVSTIIMNLTANIFFKLVNIRRSCCKSL